jgi:hypothetical protein
MYPLATGFDFKSVPVGSTVLSKVETSLLLFAMGIIAMEHTDRFLAEDETRAKRC